MSAFEPIYYFCISLLLIICFGKKVIYFLINCVLTLYRLKQNQLSLELIKLANSLLKCVRRNQSQSRQNLLVHFKKTKRITSTGEHVKGWGRKRPREEEDVKEDCDFDYEESLLTKFRRGEELPSDVELEESTASDDAPDEISDGDWNMMGAALEREFLEGE